jgi:hypothetical protein
MASDKDGEGEGFIMWFLHLGPVSAAVVASTTLTLAAPGVDDPMRDVKTMRSSRDAVVAANATRGCAEVVNDRHQLRVRLIPTRGFEEQVLEVARAEVDTIWRQYQVDIIWEPVWKPHENRRQPDLWVQFVDHMIKGKAGSGAPAVAWIPFSAGVPLNFIRVSRPAATALLVTRSWVDGRPLSTSALTLLHLALGRIIGRALAHEIGHYLLASPKHAEHGLMQAVIDPAQLVKPGAECLTLKDGDVRALRAARLVSCEVAAAQ